MRVPSKIAVNADILGDILGMVLILAILVAAIWIGHGLDLPTGGDDLLLPPTFKTSPD